MKFVTKLKGFERDAFETAFYALLSLDDRTAENACPWGAPWTHGSNIELHGETIQEMAQNYFKSVEQEILELVAQEEEENATL